MRGLVDFGMALENVHFLSWSVAVGATVLACIYWDPWGVEPAQLESRPFLPEAIPVVNFTNGGERSEHSIPRIVHQTYKSHALPGDVQRMVDTWEDKNPGWEIRLYNDSECLGFVRSSFPEYLDAYLALPKNVKRADFFRYMVVLLHGGVYADSDTECKRPLDSVISSKDKMLAGWELEFGTEQEAAQRTYARTRQVLQWVFAAIPGHPVLREACDQIAENAEKHFSTNTEYDTLERTGPGMFTDIVLKHAFDPEKGVRILPRVVFGANSAGDDGLHTDFPDVAVHHHFTGSWKPWMPTPWNMSDLVRNCTNSTANFTANCTTNSTANSTSNSTTNSTANFTIINGTIIVHLNAGRQDGLMKLRDSNTILYPVGVPWEPSFVIMVHRKHHGTRAGNSDVDADITTWGNWQAGMHAYAKPQVVNVLVGLLDYGKGRGMVDIGAGLGLFTLAAASHGHPVVAFESDPKNIKALKKSVEYNRFGSYVRIESAAMLEVHSCEKETEMNALQFLQHILTSARQKLSAPEHPLYSHGLTPDEMFHGKYLNGMQFGGLRIGANAAALSHEIIAAALKSQATRGLKVVVIEFMPFFLKSCLKRDPLEVLNALYQNGFKDVYHAGNHCKDAKAKPHGWKRFFQSRIKQGDIDSPLWCKIEQNELGSLLESAVPGKPVNLIFTKQRLQLFPTDSSNSYQQ